MTVHAINVADETGKMAQKAGTTSEILSALAYAGKISALSMEDLGMSLKFLSNGMIDTAEKGYMGEGALRKLQIAATDSSGQLRDSHQVLLDVAQAFSKMEDGAQKTAMATELFGRAGMNMIPMLNQGRAGIAELEAEAGRLGLVIGTQTAKEAEA